MKKLIASILFLFSFWFQPVAAQQDSIRVSLLTCAPGGEIYSLFGHTAIRYENLSQKEDIVYNYGMFSFNSPHFILRFVKGETDYQLGITPYDVFAWQYAMRGSSVYQQVLNLTTEEKLRLHVLLEENYRPENRTYRYNYFYDNCTTRARDRIEDCIDGEVVYPEGKEGKSFRGIVRQFTHGHDWDELGIDLCLGSEADAPIDTRQQMFSPFYMLDAAKNAQIVSGDNVRPMVLEEIKIVDVEPDEDEGVFPLSPMACALILLAVTGIVGWLQLKTGKVMWAWDLILFGAQGLAGCIIAFLFFFSTHPTVGSNWLIILFNPIPLLYLPVMVYRAVRNKKDLYHALNAVCLTLFIIIMAIVQQKFNVTVLPLVLSLLTCSVCHLLFYRRNNR